MGKPTTRTLKRLLSKPENLAKLAASMLAPIKHDLKYQARIGELFRKFDLPCAKCKVLYTNHHNGDIKHPFFGTNLEHLEWASIQAENHV